MTIQQAYNLVTDEYGCKLNTNVTSGYFSGIIQFNEDQLVEVYINADKIEIELISDILTNKQIEILDIITKDLQNDIIEDIQDAKDIEDTRNSLNNYLNSQAL